jgi:ubiquinone/menaquinone biosynthesis C-methylase UbiE
MNKKQFYEDHTNFSERNFNEYYISPGIRCKFDLLEKNLNRKIHFRNAIDIGCSGNSFLYLLKKKFHKSFLDLAILPLKQYSSNNFSYPICGDVLYLPYRDESFNFITVLDVLEHIKDDEYAVSEISRILKKDGLLIITVPNRMKYFTYQDKLIGHYRRYEIEQFLLLLKKYRLKKLRTFGVYGKLMRIADIQSKDPLKIEKDITKLREMYQNNTFFRKFWNIVVKFISYLMKLDAKYQSQRKVMDFALFLVKI